MTRWRDDQERVRQVRLVHLCGERDRLQYRRDQLRRELAFELQRCGVGYRSDRAVELEEQIRLSMDEWLMVINELRELASTRSTAA